MEIWLKVTLFGPRGGNLPGIPFSTELYKLVELGVRR